MIGVPPGVIMALQHVTNAHSAYELVKDACLRFQGRPKNISWGLLKMSPPPFWRPGTVTWMGVPAMIPPVQDPFHRTSATTPNLLYSMRYIAACAVREGFLDFNELCETAKRIRLSGTRESSPKDSPDSGMPPMTAAQTVAVAAAAAAAAAAEGRGVHLAPGQVYFSATDPVYDAEGL